MPRIYRVVGTDKDGIPVETRKSSGADARRAADEMNDRAAKRGRPQDWCAEAADIEWRPIDADATDLTALDRVRELANRWENATELSSGTPSIVTRAFAAEVRKALDEDQTQ